MSRALLLTTLAAAFAFVGPPTLRADPTFSFGAGYLAGEGLPTQPTPSPFGWLGLRSEITEQWSAQMRIGYHDLTVEAPPIMCVGPQCFEATGHDRRAVFVPMSWGMRLAAGRSTRTQGYLEASSSVTWARFERLFVRFDSGGTSFIPVASEHWLMGLELGAGFHHPVHRKVGIEWGVRWSPMAAPPDTPANLGIGNLLFRDVALVVGLTLRADPREASSSVSY